MPQKEKNEELEENEKQFAKMCDLIKKQIKKLEQKSKKPISRRIWKWKVTI